jgi:dienelactone hydrolase
MSPAIHEQAVLFGQEASLVGIVTQPVRPTNYPAVVILNTGIIHRVGHHRMYVTMARKLARDGFTVLRFDFSGIGDSENRTNDMPPRDTNQADIAEALDWLETSRQLSRVVLVGLCWGADQAVLYGHSDRRVVALALMDPSIPATTKYYLHYLSSRLVRPRTWINAALGRSRIMRLFIERLVYALRAHRWDATSASLPNPRIRARFEEAYKRTVERNMNILAIFTGGQEATRQTYREQIIDAFPKVRFGRQLRLEFFRESDHTFGKAADRAQLIELIAHWATDIARPAEDNKADGMLVSGSVPSSRVA